MISKQPAQWVGLLLLALIAVTGRTALATEKAASINGTENTTPLFASNRHLLPPCASLDSIYASKTFALRGQRDSAESPRLCVTPAESLAMLQNPRGWNRRYTLTAAGAAAAFLLVALLWVVTPRRGAAEQTPAHRERRDGEAAAEAGYRELFEEAGDLIFTVDPDGRLSWLNPAARRILGYPADSTGGPSIDQILAPSSRAVWQHLLETPPSDRTTVTIECEFVTRDGRPLWLEMSAQLKFKDGKVGRIQAIARDIGERKRVEYQLRRTVSLFRSTLEAAADGILVVDSAGQVVSFNERFLSLWRIPPEISSSHDNEILLRQVAAQLKDPGAFLSKVRELHASPAVESFGVVELKDGRVFEHYSRPQWLDGVSVGRVWSFRDDTARRQADAARAEASALLQALLDNAPDHICFKDRQSRFLRCSKAFEDLFGVRADGLFGKTDFDIFTEEHARPAYEDEQEIIRTGKPVVGKLEKETHQDGRITWVLSTKMPLRNKEGDILGTFGISKDVTAIKEAEAELAYERELLRTLLDNSPDTIYFKDLNSRFVQVSRSKAQAALEVIRENYLAGRLGRDCEELPPHLAGADALATHLIGKTDAYIYGEEFASATFEEEQTIIRTGRPVISKTERIVPVGRWMLTTKLPWRDKDGKVIGTFGISRNITALKEAEAQLEATHQRLVETSRLAGMAEVATDVLHNVGNVLNSVNVSCSLALDHVKSCKINSLQKVSSLLMEHRGRLAEFLDRNERGRQVPQFLFALTDHMAGEQTLLLEELKHLASHIDHIKQIVAMQQTYAKVVGVHETVTPLQLVEDALQINAAALSRHEVRVQREYAQTPPIITEKHKVLQILVNLIRNAKYAMDDARKNEKNLTVKVIETGSDELKIQVVDNGVGIPKENLTRIFSHGFTTRRNGHGFGLHSSALAARDIGGSLEAHSEGPGTGATFTLTLPRMPREHPPKTL